MRQSFKSLIPDIIIFIVFVVASMIYFYPALEGKIIYAGDDINGLSAVHEGAEYLKTGGNSFWTGSMFSGMPNYQIGGGRYLAQDILLPLRRFMKLGNENTIFILLFYLVCFYLLLRAFKINKWLCMAGAFAIALSSYFLIIVAAHHNSKCVSITWMTLILAAFVLCFQKRYAISSILTMVIIHVGFFTHPQMSYYICLLIGVLYCAELYIHIKEKRYKDLGIGTAVFAVSFLIGMGIGSADIFTNTEYASQTMRGGHSDLSKASDSENKTKGLDLDYATAWSYGVDETMTLLIPNFMGGASGYSLDKESVMYKELVRHGVPAASAKQFVASAPTYRGEKAFTSGPVYVGAIICMLFIFGLIVVPGPYKWALLIATLFSITLSWGRNFMGLTELFFHYFPMYNKFRAVESILVVAEITIPLLAFLSLKELTEGKIDPRRLRTGLMVSVGLTGIVCLFAALFPSAFDLTSSYDAQWNDPQRLPDFVYDAVLAQREEMLRSDAWRSLVFILLGGATVYVYANLREKRQNEQSRLTIGLALALTVLIVADMWAVDRRYCNEHNFVNRNERDKVFKMQPYEKQILEDESTYRVLNLSTNTFNDARTSYYLKSIGGYSAAKLRRYQDLIDVHLVPEISSLYQAINLTNGFRTPCDADHLFPVLNMLNMKYAILPLQDKRVVPLLNPYAMGNAWFVDSLLVVDTPNEEIEALHSIDLHHQAVVDRSQLPDSTPLVSRQQQQEPPTITLLSYKPDRLSYHASTKEKKTVVFSEIYYPYGWKALVDGQPVEHYRVNYTLRALDLEAGEHDIEFYFAPDSVRKGNILSVICLCIALLICIGWGVVGWLTYKKKKQ